MCPEEGRPDQGVRLRLILGVPRAVFCAGGTISHSCRQRCCHILPYAWCFLVRRGIFCLFVSFGFCFPSLTEAAPMRTKCGPVAASTRASLTARGAEPGAFRVHVGCRRVSLGAASVWVLRPFSIRVVCFSFFSFLCCKSSLSVLDIKPLSDDLICKCFLSLWGVLWLWGVL